MMMMTMMERGGRVSGIGMEARESYGVIMRVRLRVREGGKGEWDRDGGKRELRCGDESESQSSIK